MSRLTSSLLTVLLLAAANLRAQTWNDGGTGNNWNTRNNWSPNTTPSFNNSTDLIFTNSTRLTPDLNGSRTVNSVAFSSSASGFTLLGDNGPNNVTLTFNGTGAALTQSSAADPSLPMNRIRFSAAKTIDPSRAGRLFLGDDTANAGLFYGNLALNAGLVEARHSSAHSSTTGASGILSPNSTTSTFGKLELTDSSVLDFGSSPASTLTINNVTFQNNGLQLNVQNCADFTDYFYAVNCPDATPDLRGFLPTNQVVFSGYNGTTPAGSLTSRRSPQSPSPAFTVRCSSSLSPASWLGAAARRSGLEPTEENPEAVSA